MKLSFVILFAFVFIFSGCKKAAATDDDTTTPTAANPTPTPAADTGLTNASLVGTWYSSCTAFTPNVANSGAAYHYYQFIVTTSGTYYFYDQWYSNAGCTPGHWVLYLNSTGSYTVGALVSGSTTTYNLSFTATGDGIVYPLNQVAPTGYATTAAWLSGAGCPGGGFTFSSGQPTTLGSYACAFIQSPGTGSTAYNIVQISGTTMMVGAPSGAYSFLGVATLGAVPATTTVSLVKQ